MFFPQPIDLDRLRKHIDDLAQTLPGRIELRVER
jgi:hypothetical protein